jgi:hypothetical protein
VTFRPTKLQRLTAMSVSALLAANAAVLVTGLADDLASSDPGTPGTITYIVGADGSTIAVDPSTPEGWRAIAEAEQRGVEVVTVDASEAPDAVRQATTTTIRTTTTARPGTQIGPAGSGITIPSTEDVDELLDDTITSVVDTLEDVTDTVDDTVDDVTDIVDDTTGTDVGDTVDSVVDDTTDTITTTVSTIAETITDQTLPQVTVPAVTVPPATVPEVTVPALP